MLTNTNYQIALLSLLASLGVELMNVSWDRSDDVLEKGLSLFGQLLNVDRSYIFLFEGDISRQIASNTHEWCAEGVTSFKNELQFLPINKFQWWGRKIKNDEIIDLSSLSDLPDVATQEKMILDFQGIISLLVVPMTYRGHSIGFIGFDSVRERRFWTDEEISTLRLLAGIFSSALIRWQNEKNVAELTEKLESQFQQTSKDLKLVLESIGEGFIEINSQGNFLHVNSSYCQMIGYNREDLLSMTLADVCPEFQKNRAFFNTLKEKQGTLSYFHHTHKDGHVLELTGNGCHVPYDNDRFFIFVWDVTQKRQMERDLRDALARYDRLIENAGEIIARFAVDNLQVDMLNPVGEKLSGYSLEDFQKDPGLTYRLMDPDSMETFQRTLEILTKKKQKIDSIVLTWTVKGGRRIDLEHTLIPLKDEQGVVRYVESIARNVTERLRMEELIRYQATHDALTGLPNRLLFIDRLNQAIKHALRSGTLVAVAFMDLDNFKNVNDTWGHTMGDKLLVQVARRLETILRDVDTVARIGGDEFLFVFTDVFSTEQVLSIAKRMHMTLSSPFHIDEIEIAITPSIGVSLFPDHGTDINTLLKKADSAMYCVKRRGRNGIKMWRDSIK